MNTQHNKKVSAAVPKFKKGDRVLVNSAPFRPSAVGANQHSKILYGPLGGKSVGTVISGPHDATKLIPFRHYAVYFPRKDKYLRNKVYVKAWKLRRSA